MIGSETLNDYLERLASREPTPGGGAAGALHAAQGAALIAMVARYTTGARYAQHEEESLRIAARADEIIPAALQLADDDEKAFAAVIAAYRLPSASDEDRAARSRAVQEATVAAAAPPRALIGLATEVVDLGRQLAEFSNPNVISDVAAASEAARAAIATALITLDMNINAITDERTRTEFRDELHHAHNAILAAQIVTDRVREKVMA
ncbi:formimidoyltetrahydrofolate cyclodeaminase [Kocuria sediminis]|uniref:Formimidoyltetrahydrofolate cyclodeaminase n=1 Tax=Kocuria sediminis TaxID=1038857 RepID=A0A6N8GQ77_9MICC|nr:cyclodeaminase/cyclohydrolase family protein [Kocuria sediminis]MUN64939.1 formimidoyltetrahydrofolate cyclodeaminase [Kocuria sediminis]